MFGQNAGTTQLRCALPRSAHPLRAGGIRRKLLIFLLLTFAAVGVLPIVIAKTHLRNILVALAIPNNAVRVTIGEASLSWISNPSLSNIEIKDASGDTLLVAESIQINRTPLKLALNTHDLGTIHIVHPTLHVQVRPDGNSINDLLQKLAGNSSVPVEQRASAGSAQADSKTQSSPTTTHPPVFTIELVGATILADDVATNRQWRMQNVDVQYDGRAGVDRLGPGSASGEIFVVDRGTAPIPAGRFALSIKSTDGNHAE